MSVAVTLSWWCPWHISGISAVCLIRSAICWECLPRSSMLLSTTSAISLSSQVLWRVVRMLRVILCWAHRSLTCCLRRNTMRSLIISFLRITTIWMIQIPTSSLLRWVQRLSTSCSSSLTSILCRTNCVTVPTPTLHSSVRTRL